MTLTIEPETPPLRMDEDGVARVGRTRVRLATIVDAFLLGATPEAIAGRFPTVGLADIYAVIWYYLRHREAVDAYLKARESEAERIREEFEDEFAPARSREKALTARP